MIHVREYSEPHLEFVYVCDLRRDFRYPDRIRYMLPQIADDSRAYERVTRDQALHRSRRDVWIREIRIVLLKKVLAHGQT